MNEEKVKIIILCVPIEEFKPQDLGEYHNRVEYYDAHYNILGIGFKNPPMITSDRKIIRDSRALAEKGQNRAQTPPEGKTLSYEELKKAIKEGYRP